MRLDRLDAERAVLVLGHGPGEGLRNGSDQTVLELLLVILLEVTTVIFDPVLLYV